MNIQHLILKAACSVCGCSMAQAKSATRVKDVAMARVIYYALAMDAGIRSYEAAWFLGKGASAAYFYKSRLDWLMKYDPQFNVLLNNAKVKYERLRKSL